MNQPLIKVGFVICALGLVVLAVTVKSFSSLCKNNIIKSSDSPDKFWKVVLFERDCGATTDYSSQVSLLSAGATLEDEAGNIFIAESRSEGYALTWTDTKSILISGIKGEIFKQELSKNGISIRYQSAP